MLATVAVYAQTNVNVAQEAGDQAECAIAKNPNDHSQIFVLCNSECNCGGLFASRSTDYGRTWMYPNATKTLADANSGLPPACCDPSLAWDNFGNLFAVYVGSLYNEIEVVVSKDGGQSFSLLTSFKGSVDQPTVTASGGAVWVVWNQAAAGSGFMYASGARVNGLGSIDPFSIPQQISGTANCSFGDVAISPAGAVVQVCQDTSVRPGIPANILVSTRDSAGHFDTAHIVSTTNMPPFDLIKAQPRRSVDSESGLAYDLNPLSPHFGRLYLVYTADSGYVDSTDGRRDDLDIFVRSSDDDGVTWSDATRVNDDTTHRSQFLPRIASDPKTGNIAICWADSRNDPNNVAIQEFCTIATPATFPSFTSKNLPVSNGSSANKGRAFDFGDYGGLTYLGSVDPIWGDTSNSTQDNPDGTSFVDAYAGFMSGHASAGDDGAAHITTINGSSYDLQASGDFIALRGEGVEIQTREVEVSSNFVNDGFAARVGSYRVTWIGDGDPNGPTLRVDGTIRTLSSSGITLSGGGRITNPGTADSIEIEFPDGTLLFANAAYWSTQGVWMMNIDIEHAAATEGLMGETPPSNSQRGFADSWRVTPQNTLFDSIGVPPELKALTSVDQDAKTLYARVLGVSEAIRAGATFTTVKNTGATSFTATVSRQLSDGATPTGKVQFLLNGQAAGEPIALKDGAATFQLSKRPRPAVGSVVLAQYIPAEGSVFLPSVSGEKAMRESK